MILIGESITLFVLRTLSNLRTSVVCKRFVVKLIIDGCFSKLVGMVMLRCFCYKLLSTKNVVSAVSMTKRRSLNLENLHWEGTMNIVGTGFNQSKQINISTISCFMTSNNDVVIVKHGGARVSSRCGSADMILKLQCSNQYDLRKVHLSALESGIGVMAAGASVGFLERLRHQREKLNLPSLLNLVFTVINLTNARHYVLGSSICRLATTQLLAAGSSGVCSALVLCGQDRTDKFSIRTLTKVLSYKNSRFYKARMCPELLGTLVGWEQETVEKEGEAFLARFLNVINCSTHPAAQAVISHSGIIPSNGATAIVSNIEKVCTRVFEGEAFRRVAMFLRLNQCLPLRTRPC